MGGLACALSLARQGFTKIDVYETASNLGFVGAGIQLAPNMARILDRFGVWDEIAAEAVDLKETSIRRENSHLRAIFKLQLTDRIEGSTDKELAHVDLNYIRSTYNYPHMVGHRASLAGGMFNGCKRENAIKFHFSHQCEGMKTFSPKPKFTVTPRGKEPFDVECDVVLACDGVKSKVREQILTELGVHAQVQDTGQAAYRIMLTREEMLSDPELAVLIDADKVTRWIGEKRHIIAYPVSSKKIYNISTAQPDTNFAAEVSATYTTKGSKKQMLEVYGDFCPMIHRMLNLVPEGEVCEWRLRTHSRLPTWVHGCVALVGDACHPTLPHLAQGAAQAIEDAAVLGVTLVNCPDGKPESINKSLKVYEKVRYERAYTLVDLAAASGRALHLGDGAAKEERDKQFEALKKGKGAVPDKWADADVQKNIYGTDVMQEAQDNFQTFFNEA